MHRRVPFPTPASPLRPSLAALALAPAPRAAQSRPAPARTADPRERRQRTTGPAGSPPSSCTDSSSATSRCSAATSALAARAYFEAARDARDARLARRATEIALAARQRALAIEAAQLWSELDPAAERPKQVIAGLSSGGGEGSGRSAPISRPSSSARSPRPATAGSRLGEAFLQLNRLLASEPDKAATLQLVRSLAQPYPNVPEAQFAVALAAYNTGLTDVGPRARSRCRRSTARSR